MEQSFFWFGLILFVQYFDVQDENYAGVIGHLIKEERKKQATQTFPVISVIQHLNFYFVLYANSNHITKKDESTHTPAIPKLVGMEKQYVMLCSFLTLAFLFFIIYILPNAIGGESTSFPLHADPSISTLDNNICTLIIYWFLVDSTL